MKLRVLIKELILLLIFLSVYFVSVILPSYRVQLLLISGVLTLIYILVIKRGYLVVNRLVILWSITAILIILSMFFHDFDQFYLLFYLVSISLMFVVDYDEKDCALNGIKLIYWAGIFFAICTIIQVLAGNFYIKFMAPLLNVNSTFDPIRFMKLGIYSGLTYQTGVNAMYLAMGIGASYILFLNAPKQKKRIYLFAIGLEIICIILSAKRGHLLFTGLALLLTVFFTTSQSRRFSNTVKVIIVLFITLLLVYYLVPSASLFFDRLFNPGDDITNGRLDRYKEALRIFRDNPIFGIGWEQFRYTYQKYSDVHNVYLQLLCETGIVGTIFFIYVFIASLRQSIRSLRFAVESDFKNEKSLLSFSLYIQLFFLLYGLTGNGLYDYYILFFYFFAILIMLKVNKDFNSIGVLK